MHSFILAGGFATRLWPLTEKRAKPLLPLAGKPIITHLVERIPEDIPITVSTNAAFAEGFERWRENLKRSNVAVLTEQTRKDTEKLGALGAIAQWIEHAQIEEDVLLLAGDNYIGFSIEKFLKAYRDGIPLLAAHDIRDHELAKAFGSLVIGDDGRTVMAFEEKPAAPRTTFVSTGCFVLPQHTLSVLTAFARQKPDNVGGIFEEFLRQGMAVDCCIFGEPWFDVGSFASYIAATVALVGDDVRMGSLSTCTETICEGSVVLGDRSHVERSTLCNAVIFDDCRIEDCVLEDCILDDHCHLKGVELRGKMLRGGTDLRQD